MSHKLIPTIEQQAAFQSDAPVYFVDEHGTTTHVALPLEEARRLLIDHLRRELEPAFHQADAGQVEVWNMEKSIAAARQKYPTP